MAFAYAQATVPRICHAEESYGGATLSWRIHGQRPLYLLASEIAVMEQRSVEILHRKANEEERSILRKNMRTAFLIPMAAERGSVDIVLRLLKPEVVFAALQPLLTKREKLQERLHANTSLNSDIRDGISQHAGKAA